MFDLGSVIDFRYRIDAKLGEGGMGVVYKAFDLELEKTVALKTLLPQLKGDPGALKDLRREVALSQELHHPHIVAVYHLETRGELPYLTMEYVNGRTLIEILAERGPLDEATFRDVAGQIAAGLAYAHERKVIHRDLKPHNVMIDAGGQAKLMDFGIAAAVKESYTRITGQAITGTLLYMAPEYIRGGDPDRRADIYALGCMFYELLSGRPPFWRGDVTYQHIAEPPKPLEGIAPDLSALVMRCLEKDPGRRCQTMRDVLAAMGVPAGAAGSGRVVPAAVTAEGQPEPTPGRTVKLDEAGYRAAAASASGVRASAASGREAPRAAQPVELPDPQRAGRPAAGGSRSGEPALAAPSPLKRYLPLLGVLGAVLVLLIGWALWKGYEGVEYERRQLEEQRQAEDARLERERNELQRRREEAAERQRQAEADRRSAESRTAAVHSASGDDVVSLGSGVSLRMNRIPAGSFMMGASPGDSEAESDESPAHRVTISREFYLGVTEVTQAQWRAVMGTNPSHFTGDDRPVEQVSWEDAVAFCEKLSQRTGQKYRLPTEAEWEYAARAGTTTEYYWGSSMDGDYAWYKDNSGSQTHPVGQKRPNGWGLYDMSGNVWEWCADWYDSDYYGQSPSTDPKGARSGGRRVLRGGSWGDVARRLRVSDRDGGTPGGRSNCIGFRLVREGS